MNIFDLADKSGISVKKLRVLDKLGGLRHDANATPLDGIAATIRSGNRLSVAQLVYLIENPAGALELGDKYAGKAQTQLDELGRVKGQEAPRSISALILDAFENNPEAVAAVVGWCKSIIPAEPVGHSYIATRLLLGVPENLRVHDFPRLRRLMSNCREHPEFAGWWHKEKVSSRNRTVYQKTALDL